MITKKEQHWQRIVQNSVTDANDLCRLIPAAKPYFADNANQAFPLKVTRRYLAKINPQDACDPLLLQILPLAKELHTHPDFTTNPLQENDYNPLPGLIHKYATRVLITLVGSCVIHCRYCFRRHFAYEDNRPGSDGLQAIYDYIRQHPHINEVILSGGEPLLANDTILNNILLSLSDIPHVTRLRIHTRMITTIPERITDDLINSLTATRLKVIVVTHCNHANELDEDIGAACAKLLENKITVLNQSVFLAGVNDDATILTHLSEALFKHHILPYYLHSLDLVAGSAHFALSLEKQKAIYNALQQSLPGFLVPRWVRELPGEKCKTLQH